MEARKKHTKQKKRSSKRKKQLPEKNPLNQPLKKEKIKKPMANKSQQQKKRKKRTLKKKHKVLKTMFDILFYGVVLLIVVSSFFFAINKKEDKSFFGYRMFGVRTNSMVPRDPSKQKGGFHAGDVIIVEAISGEKAKVGEIITFRPSVKSQAFLTHRVKKKLDHLGKNEGTYYITQGDANLAEDVPIHAKQVMGRKIAVIPKVGSILNFIQSNLIASIVFIISIFCCIAIIRSYVLNK